MAGIDSYTVLMLHCDGNNTDFFGDSSPSAHPITTFGNTQTTSDQSKFGGQSGVFDGTSDYLKIPNHTDFQFGTGDFTIDCWVRFSSFSTTQNIFAFKSGGDPWQFAIDDSKRFFIYGVGGFIIPNDTVTSVVTNTWYHIAFVRYGNSWKIYLDGTEINSATSSVSVALPDHANGIMIGAEVTAPSQFFNGYIDEFRVSKGIARWTSNFTPETSAYNDVNPMKLLLHANDIDGSTSFLDDSAFSYTITANGNSQIDTAQSKFGGASGIFDGTGDYLSTIASLDWKFGADFTIDFWVRFSNTSGYQTFFQSLNPSIGKFQLAIDSSNNIYIYANGGELFLTQTGGSLSINTWYHIAVVRYGSTIKLYKDGTSVATGTYKNVIGDSGYGLSIGDLTQASGYGVNGWMDEIRIVKGVAEWTTNFTPPSSEYESASDITLNYNETITLSDSWELLQNPNPLDINEIITLTDELDITTDPQLVDINEIITLTDQWDIDTDPRQFDSIETISLSDNWNIDLFGTFRIQYATKLYTNLQIIKKYVTRLDVALQSFNKYTTKLYTQFFQSKQYSTDLRVAYFSDYNTIPLGTLEDFVVKLDGVTLVDVDYTTLNVFLNLNTTPSQARFTLSRRHDDLDKTLAGTTSIITAENKIEVFDGTRKLFTGYISEIDADSTTDTVQIVAEDIRRKLSTQSMELAYGGDWQRDSNTNGIIDADDPDTTVDDKYTYIRFEKNIETALNEVLSAIGGQISGYDALPFSGLFVPEYVKSYNDYVSLIDTLVRQTANCNWYIDENERLRYQAVGQGEIKELTLASLNTKRHPYELFINDVHLNRTPIEYAQSYLVKLGKNINKILHRHIYQCDMSGVKSFLESVNDETIFCFQRWGLFGEFFYVGINQTTYNYAYLNPPGVDWVLQDKWIIQYSPSSSLKRANTNVPDIVVGSGLPQKTIFLESYGIKTADDEYSEEMREEDGEQAPWLVEKRDEEYNNVAFATDSANFQLSQNNKKITTANASMILDAYNYYNLSFKDLINFSNTIQSNIYKNNNGFPLNIDTIQIDCSRRIVQLSLTNYGKTYYVRSGNYLTNRTAPKFRWVSPKQDVVSFSGL